MKGNLQTFWHIYCVYNLNTKNIFTFSSNCLSVYSDVQNAFSKKLYLSNKAIKPPIILDPYTLIMNT